MINLPYITFLQREVTELFETPRQKLFFLALYSLILFEAYLVVMYLVGLMQIAPNTSEETPIATATAYVDVNQQGQVLQAAGSTYYLSPDGNDNANGSSTNPWKTVSKANQVVSAGDTVVFKDGVYNEYPRITKSGTTWKAENKHAAIIDGGFAPSLLNGNWNSIVNAWDRNCGDKGRGEFGPLLLLNGVSDVTLDGLFVRNSCGRGVAVFSDKDNISENVKLTNLWIDFTFTAGVFAQGDTDSNYPYNLINFQLTNSIITRASFNDHYRIRAENDYAVNIAMSVGGINPVVQCNLIAWGRGEVTLTSGSQNGIFENNVVVGNKNSFYANHVNGATIRNNLFYAPEGVLGDDSHMVPISNEEIRDWHIGLRNEHGTAQKYNSPTNRDLSFFNNIFVNTSVNMSGYNNAFASDTHRIYFGANTLIAGEQQDKMFLIAFNARGGASADASLSALFENNIFDRRKSPSTGINANLSNNDDVVFRNNVWPTNISNEVKGPGDVYTNDPGMNNALADLAFTPPLVGAESVNVNEILTAFNINNYRLLSNSPAINRGSTAASPNETPVPALAREQDYIKSARVGAPDVGAFEVGAATVNPAFCFSTPIIQPPVDPPFIPPIYCEEPPAPPGPPPAPVGCGELAEIGLVDVTCPQYGADPTCTNDSTEAIRKATKAAQDNNMATFFPPGTYCVSDTIELIKVFGDKGEDGNAHELVGSTLGTRPIIRLKPNSPGFNSPTNPKAVVLMYTIRGKLKKGGTGEIGEINNANGFMQSIRNLDFEIEEGNAGAVAVNHSGAQNNSMQNLTVRMKSGYAGFAGFVGDNSSISNIEVVGGKYGLTNGIIEESMKWPTMTNVRLYDQTDAAIYKFSPTNWMISGLHIKKAQTPAIIADGGSSTSSNFTILDGKIEFTQQSNNPVVVNSGDKAVTFINTYFKNATNLVDNHAPSGFGGSDWKKVSEYAVTGGGVNIINGDVSGNTYAPAAQAATPPDNLLSKHGANPADYPSPDVILGLIKAGDTTVANVWDYGIFPATTGFETIKYGVGNQTSPDITDKLQNLINSGVEKIFFPKGKYVISRTIEMGENTHFIGIANQLSGLAQSDNWKPTASNPLTLIRTPDSATASPKISYFRTLWRTDPPYDHFVATHIRSGKTVFFDTYFRMNLSSSTDKTSPNRRILMTGNAGGKFYGLNMGGNEPRNQHKDYRHLLIDGTFNPIVIYGPNPEDHDFYGKNGGWGVEIRNARNVAIYGSKQENHNTLLIQNSSNIAALALSNYDNINFINTNNAIASVYPKFYDGSVLLREDYQGDVTTQAKNKEIALFKRGQVDYAALDPNIDGGDNPPDIPPPIIIPPPGDIECLGGAVAGLSTQPCSIYKEFKIVNTGNNRNWRVTGEDASAFDAQKFLPNPILDITVDDLEHAIKAEVLLDMWGGHDGTQNKRVRINGNEWINIPAPRFDLPQDNPATGVNEADPMRYLYQMNPIMDVPLEQLRQGINTIEGNANRCANGSCIGWPQWGMNAVLLRVYYDPAVKEGPTGQITFPSPNATINDYQAIHVAAASTRGVDKIDVIGNYYGYDENGDGFYSDWHRGYFVSEKGSSDVSLFDISGHIGSTTSNPGMVRWNSTWLPDQPEKGIQLIARIKDTAGYWTVTSVVNGLTLYRSEPTVGFFEPDKTSIRPGYGVRNGQTKSSTVTLPADFSSENVAQAIAHIRTWNGELHGGSDPHGTFVLNGSYTGIIGGLSHHYKYTTPEIADVGVLKPNTNTFSFSSETIHHHNEILWPGPGISVRYGVEELCPPLTPIPTYTIVAEPTIAPQILTGILLGPIIINDSQIIFTFSAPKQNNQFSAVLADQMQVYVPLEEGATIPDLSEYEANIGNRVWVEGAVLEGENLSGEYATYVHAASLDNVSVNRMSSPSTIFGVNVNWSVIIPLSMALLLIAGVGVAISSRF